MARTTIPPMDLMFYLTESPQSPKHVGAVQVFKLPPHAPAHYLRDLVEAFRQAEIVSPFNRRPHFPRFGLPEWRDDPDIEINYHVRHSALPQPGNTGQLMEVVQRLHSPMMDRNRPGWMCQIIEGLKDNRFAIYSKIHHAYIDGMSGARRMYGSLSTSPTAQNLVLPPWSAIPGVEKSGTAEAPPLDLGATLSRPCLWRRGSRALLRRLEPAVDEAARWRGPDPLQRDPHPHESAAGMGQPLHRGLQPAPGSGQGGRQGAGRHGQRRDPDGDWRRTG